MLSQREWIAIVTLLGFLVAGSIIEKNSRVKGRKILASQEKIEPKTITVLLKGGVTHPGPYICKAGTSLKSLLSEAGLKKTALRRKIPFKKIIFTSQEIEIPEKRGNS